jgi:thioredoxin 2
MTATVIECAACNTRNRVADDAAGRPRCSQCHTDLPWLIETSAARFDTIVETSALPVLVDLWAPWCGPCVAVAPILHQLSIDRAGSVRVVKVNVDHSPAVSAKLGVQGIPTMVLFSGGAEIARQVGALPADALRRWLETSLATRR